MPEPTQLLPLPTRRGYGGLQALVEIGLDGLQSLAQKQANQPLDLSLSSVVERLSEELACSEETLQRAFIDALIPLNGLRRTLGLSTSEFVKALAETVSQQAPDEWKEAHLEGWNRIVAALDPFFEPDNFFSQASKAFELLGQRPAVFQHAKILTELRPIFDETTTETLAVIQTNTLVLRYWAGEGERSVHVTLDQGDLETLAAEIDHAREKTRVSQREARRLGTNFLTYGDSSERDSS